MTSESISDWDNEYARLARAASQNRTRGFSSDVQSLQALQAGLGRLDAELDRLPLPAADVDRRRRLVQSLSDNNHHSTTQTNNNNNNNNSSNNNNNNSSVMQSAMQQQDNMIDDLAIGVGRLKHQTQLIGDEANLQTNLLGDMNEHIDEAQVGLDSGTRRAVQLKEKSSVWRLYMIIAGLSVLLVLLILMGLS